MCLGSLGEIVVCLVININLYHNPKYVALMIFCNECQFVNMKIIIIIYSDKTVCGCDTMLIKVEDAVTFYNMHGYFLSIEA